MTVAPIAVREHLVGPCAQLVGDDQVLVDVGSVVRRLVLFERYTLRTISMREMAELVATLLFFVPLASLECAATWILGIRHPLKLVGGSSR